MVVLSCFIWWSTCEVTSSVHWLDISMRICTVIYAWFSIQLLWSFPILWNVVCTHVLCLGIRLLRDKAVVCVCVCVCVCTCYICNCPYTTLVQVPFGIAIPTSFCNYYYFFFFGDFGSRHHDLSMQMGGCMLSISSTIIWLIVTYTCLYLYKLI